MTYERFYLFNFWYPSEFPLKINELFIWLTKANVSPIFFKICSEEFFESHPISSMLALQGDQFSVIEFCFPAVTGSQKLYNLVQIELSI